MPPRASWELKSQYGHLRTHHGKWMYSDSGSGATMPEAARPAGRSGTMRVVLLTRSFGAGLEPVGKLPEGGRPVREQVLHLGREFRGGLLQVREPEMRVVAEAA